MIEIITIGKKHEGWIQPGIERYQKRLRAPWDLKWNLLPHSSLEDSSARQEESERILSRLDPADFVILLDERGKSISSEQFSRQLEDIFSSSKTPKIIIGGAYGVNDDLRNRANLTLSLSVMVFPHQLVRLIISEQIYRARQIASGSKYHHS